MASPVVEAMSRHACIARQMREHIAQLFMTSYLFIYLFLNLLLCSIVSPGEPPHHFSPSSKQRPNEKSGGGGGGDNRCLGEIRVTQI